MVDETHFGVDTGTKFVQLTRLRNACIVIAYIRSLIANSLLKLHPIDTLSIFLSILMLRMDRELSDYTWTQCTVVCLFVVSSGNQGMPLLKLPRYICYCVASVPSVRTLSAWQSTINCGKWP